MKVKLIVMNIKDNNELNLIDILIELRKKEVDFFKDILLKMKGDTFISSMYRDNIIAKFKITRMTFQNRLNKFVEMGLLIRVKRGIYQLNPKYAKVIESHKGEYGFKLI